MVDPLEFFGAAYTDCTACTRYQLIQQVGKGSYGVVVAAIDRHTGERVAIKKIVDIFAHVSDAVRGEGRWIPG